MAESKPKLYFSGSDTDLAALRARLADRADILPTPPEWASLASDRFSSALAVVSSSHGALWANASFNALHVSVRARILDAATTRAQHLARKLSLRDAPPADLEATDPAGDTFSVALAELTRDESAVTIAVSARNISARKRWDARVEAIQRAGEDLLRLDPDAVRKLNAAERLQVIEQRIIKWTKELLAFDHFAIRILDERTAKLELVIKCNLPPEFDAFDIYALPEGNGISGYVAATGRSYICSDASRDELFLPGLSGAKSSLTVPLKHMDKVLGIMDIESLSPDAFTSDDRFLAETFGRYIAMAVHMLNLLVVEQTSTNIVVTHRVEDELSEPLADIVHEVDLVVRSPGIDAELVRHLERIRSDVDAIRRRVKDAAAGPKPCSASNALADATRDPLFADKRVLVADDAAKIRRIIGDVLRARGVDVTLCENGIRAIEELHAARAAGREFDLILSDIMMPDANGYQVFAAAKAVNPALPVVLMTGFGYDPHHSIVRASQEGLQSVLFKPFQVDRLIEECRKAFTK